MFKLFLAFCLLILFLTPAFALADDYGLEKTAEEAGLKQGLMAQPIEAIIGSIIKVVLSVIGILFFGLMLYGGFRWMTARGETKLVEQAKDIIQAATIGLVIVSAAYAITHFVIKSLT